MEDLGIGDLSLNADRQIVDKEVLEAIINALPKGDDASFGDMGDLEQELMDMASKSFTDSTSWFDSSVRPSLNVNIKQFQGRHDETSKYSSPSYKFKSKHFKPKLRTAIRKHEAAAAVAFFSTEDIVNIAPTDENSREQRESAMLLKEVMNIRLKKTIPWFKISIGAYQDTMVYGYAIAKTHWDHQRDVPRIDLIDPENFRIDPSTSWVDPISESPYIIEMIPMTAGEVVRRSESSGWKSVTMEQLSSARKVGSDSTRQTREGNRTDAKQRQTGVREYDLVWVHLNIINRDGVDWCFYSLGTETILSEPKTVDVMFPHLKGGRPYVMGQSNLEAHRMYPSSLAEMTRSLQREINDTTNQRRDNVNLVLDKRYVVKAGQRVDVEALKYNAPGGVIFLNDPKNDMEVLSTPDVTGSAYREQEILNMDFDDLAGTFNGGTVSSSRALNETVGGMSLLSQSASQVSEYQLKLFSESFVEPTLEQLLMLLDAYETDDQVLDMAARRSGLGYITQSHFGHNLDLTVQVGMGATNPQARSERFMMAIRNLQAAIPGIESQLDTSEIIREIFGTMGYKDGSRFIKDKESDPYIVKLEAQIQQLQAALQAKKPAELVAAEVALKRAQAVKTGVEAQFGAMQAGEVVAMMPAVAPIADAVMENAGFEPVQGGDPNLITPEIMEEARRQSAIVNMEKNNDPLEPATGMTEFNAGISGGVE